MDGFCPSVQFYHEPMSFQFKHTWLSRLVGDAVGGEMKRDDLSTVETIESLRAELAECRQLSDRANRSYEEEADKRQCLLATLEAAQIGLWEGEIRGLALAEQWSPRFKEIFGLAHDAEASQALFLKCLHPDDRDRVERAVMEAVSGVNRGEYRAEYRVIRPSDGTIRWVKAWGHAFMTREGKVDRLIGTVLDVTTGKLLEEQGRESAVLEERNRMARDIHDTLAQGFTGVIVQLEAAKGAAGKEDYAEFLHRVEQASDLARSSLAEARRSVHALRPHSLCERTLSTALDGLLKQMSDGTSLNAELRIEGKSRILAAAWEETLLRITQEALTNTIKHARARNFQVLLSFCATEIRLRIMDDGRGFGLGDETDGFGLIGMKERVVQIGGRFDVRSNPGAGVEIHVSLGMPNESNPDPANA